MAGAIEAFLDGAMNQKKSSAPLYTIDNKKRPL